MLSQIKQASIYPFKKKKTGGQQFSSGDFKNKNDLDLYLLYSNPAELVARHQKTIEIITHKFIRSGWFSMQEKEDAIQQINEQLLSDKITKMRAHFNGSTFVATYLSKIIYNLCLEIKRKQKQPELVQTEEIENEGAHDQSTFNSLVIQDEVGRLKAILQMFHKTAPKLIFCLKLLCRRPLSETDIYAWCAVCQKNDCSAIVQYFSDDYTKMNEKEIYAFLTPFFNKYENKQNSVDALRKWFNLKIREIIELLNGKPKESNYDKETFTTLLQYYFEKDFNT